MDTESISDVWVGVKRQRPGYRFSTVDYDHYQLIAVQSGQLTAEFGDGVRRCGPGMLLVLVPETAFDLWCDAGGYRGIGINLVELCSGAGLPGRSLAFPADAHLRQLVGLIDRELTLAEPGSRLAVNHLALGLVQLADRAARALERQEPLDDIAYWAERVRQAIDNHLGSDLPLRAVLDGLGLGYRQLTRHFMAEMGMAPKQYQLLRRIEEARRLLEETRLPVTSIALELGFPSSQHFATQFKRITGTTPSDCRRDSAVAV